MNNLNIENSNINFDNGASTEKIDLNDINVCDTPVKLYFNARDWHFNNKCKKIGCRTYVTDFFGNMVEAYCIGNWNKDWTEIHSEQLTLKKNTDHIFTFWLNGGENDRYEEVCSFEILFNDDYENRYIYKLNRNYIKYSMYYQGWYLYEIPFTTKNNEYTQLRFSAFDAHCAIIPAKDKSFYGNLAHEEPVSEVPQRHNLVFSEGYPRDSHWSWKVFGKKNESNSWNGINIPNFNMPDINIPEGFFNQNNINIQEKILERIDIDDIISRIDLDDIADEIADRLNDELENLINIDNLANEIKKQVKSQFRS